MFFILTSLGEYTIQVEAAGYKVGQSNISLHMAVKSEVEVRLERDTPTNVSPGPVGESILAPKAREALNKGLQAIRDDKLEEAGRALDQAMKLAPSTRRCFMRKVYWT